MHVYTQHTNTLTYKHMQACTHTHTHTCMHAHTYTARRCSKEGMKVVSKRKIIMQLIFSPTTLQHYSTIMSCTTEQMMQCMLANWQVVPVAIHRIAVLE